MMLQRRLTLEHQRPPSYGMQLCMVVVIYIDYHLYKFSSTTAKYICSVRLPVSLRLV